KIPAHRDPVRAWLGEPVAIKEPTAASFRRQSGANLLMVGQQDELAFSMAIASLVSLATQMPPGEAAACLHMVVAHPLQGDAEAIHQVLPEILPIRLVPQRDLPALLDQLADEMNRRLKGESD